MPRPGRQERYLVSSGWRVSALDPVWRNCRGIWLLPSGWTSHRGISVAVVNSPSGWPTDRPTGQQVTLECPVESRLHRPRVVVIAFRQTDHRRLPGSISRAPIACHDSSERVRRLLIGHAVSIVIIPHSAQGGDELRTLPSPCPNAPRISNGLTVD